MMSFKLIMPTCMETLVLFCEMNNFELLIVDFHFRFVYLLFYATEIAGIKKKIFNEIYLKIK